MGQETEEEEEEGDKVLSTIISSDDQIPHSAMVGNSRSKHAARDTRSTPRTSIFNRNLFYS